MERTKRRCSITFNRVRIITVNLISDQHHKWQWSYLKPFWCNIVISVDLRGRLQIEESRKTSRLMKKKEKNRHILTLESITKARQTWYQWPWILDKIMLHWLTTAVSHRATVHRGMFGLGTPPFAVLSIPVKPLCWSSPKDVYIKLSPEKNYGAAFIGNEASIVRHWI